MLLIYRVLKNLPNQKQAGRWQQDRSRPVCARVALGRKGRSDTVRTQQPTSGTTTCPIVVQLRPIDENRSPQGSNARAEVTSALHRHSLQLSCGVLLVLFDVAAGYQIFEYHEQFLAAQLV